LLGLDDFQTTIDGLSEMMALIDCDCRIVAVNARWQHAVELRQALGFQVGCDYSATLRELIDAGDERLRPILSDFTDVCAVKRESFRCLYIGGGLFTGHDYKMHFSRLELRGRSYVVISAQDLTEVNELKRQRRRIGSQVLRAQEGERRRIARELHDSTSQLLVALQLNLASLKRAKDRSTSEALIADCNKVLQEVHREIRGLSFMAHPPSLPVNGLATALESLVTGFASRSGLEIDFQVSDADEGSASVQSALYRLAQEALANIHRHSAAKRASVRLVGTKRCFHLIISDDGIGFDLREGHGARTIGVGIVGMAERVSELGGRFSMRRAPAKGTILSVSIPRWKRNGRPG
jgi:signal transduction histidine kinase